MTKILCLLIILQLFGRILSEPEEYCSAPLPCLITDQMLTIFDDDEYPHRVHVEVLIYHSPNFNGDAYNVTITGGSDYTDIYWSEFEGVSVNDPDFRATDDRHFSWYIPLIVYGDNVTFSYVFGVINDGEDLADEGFINIDSFVEFQSASGDYINAADYQCIQKNGITEDDIFTDYGFTVLALICAFIFGAVIVLLILFIIYKVRRRVPFGGASVKPATVVDNPSFHRLEMETMHKTISKQSEGLVMNPKNAAKQSLHASQDQNTDASSAESFVAVLIVKDKLKMMRDLDSLDIQNTIKVDQDIEVERDNAMVDATTMLVQTLKDNGDIPKGVEDKNTDQFKKNINKLDKEMDNDFKKEMEKMFKHLSTKNKEKLSAMMEKQADNQEDLKDKMRNMTDEEKEEVKKLMDEEHETERQDLIHRLKLEQDEEREKLRKEFAIRKRMGIKGHQQEYLDGVKKDAKLTDEQANWLMSEHIKNQTAIDKLYDDEISRQRMVLEEKLARRRALAEAKDLQEENDSEVLNSIAGHQMQLLQRAKKQGVLSSDEAAKMIEEAQEDMMNTKKRLDADREKQEKALNKKLSDRKKQRMQEQNKLHKKELADFNSKKGNSTDPLTQLEDRQNLLSKQRTEKSELENEIDMENASELDKLRQDVVKQGQDQLERGKNNLLQNLCDKGMDAEKLIKKHKKEMEELSETQSEEKMKQMENFKKRLAKNRKEWTQRRKEEEEEQDQLREHEEKVVKQLMDNQVAISEEERQKILQEHEKQMVKLENNLTLGKLQQKRMLEEKLARKREMQMEKLEMKQAKESKKQKKNEDSDEDVAAENEVNMLKKHAEQRIAIMQGEKLEIEEEMEEVQEELMKGRAEALKEQEVKLAAMMAQLQVEKAKEMAKIEEQQKAIHNLKSNLMDDLNEKGILSDPECQKVIQIHQQEQEQLNNKLNSQRQKQEEALKKKLRDRLKQKEDHLTRLQSEQIKDAGAGGLKAKLKRAALLSRHMVEKEKFRNQMEKEISQTLEELRRQQEMRTKELAQDQEIQFINGLVRLGKFNANELNNVVQLLFPAMSSQGRSDLLGKLMEGYEAPSPSKGQKQKLKRRGTLESRVLSTVIGDMDDSRNRTKRRDDNIRRLSLLPETKKPKDLGRKHSLAPRRISELQEDFPSAEGRLRPLHLPPMDTNKKKKKNRVLASRNEYDYH